LAAFQTSTEDRLVHNAEIVTIEGESYRLKEGQEKAAERARRRRGRSTAARKPR